MHNLLAHIHLTETAHTCDVCAVRFARVLMYMRVCVCAFWVPTAMYVRVCAAPGAHKNAFGHIRIAFHVCAVHFARVLMYVRICMCAFWVPNAMYMRMR